MIKIKRLRKIRTPIFVAAMLLFSAAIGILHAEDESTEIILNFSFSQPSITEVIINGTLYDRVTMEGSPADGDVGVPVLPLKPVNVLLPQKGMLESIDVSYEGNISLGDGFNVELGPEPVAPGTNMSNESGINFDVSRPYPTELFSNIGIQYFRGYAILTLVLYPVHYIGETGELYYYEEMTVVIETMATGAVSPLFRGLPGDELMMQQKVDDYSMQYTYISVEAPVYNSSIVNPDDNYEYVIITNEILKNADGDHTFQDLINYKTATGTNTAVVTVEEITNDPCYWNLTNPMFNDTQAQIRSFITHAYKNWGLEYVLIGGDDDIVPARKLYFGDYDNREYHGPSDEYYICLEGNYNSDEDDKWGELTDGQDIPEGDGYVDLMAEVYIGRACAGNSEEVSNFVYKTLEYMNVFEIYLNNVLMVGEKMKNNPLTWGGDHTDEIINGSNANGYTTVGVPSDEYNITTLYDRDWPGNDWPKSEIKNRINKNIHIINHMGHASYQYNMKLKNQGVDALTNDKHCFIYSQGCNSGGFDKNDPDCIAEHFTVKTEHGAFAGIWNARFGWYAPGSTRGTSQRFAREFFDSIFGESQNNSRMRELGIANQDSKEDNLWRINYGHTRWCYYELNLFGDPQNSIKHGVEINLSKPATPEGPTGLDSGQVGTYSTYINWSDPDAEIKFKWDWGDGMSDWTEETYSPGEICEASHAWTNPTANTIMKVDIRVVALIKDDIITDWSDSLGVGIKGPVIPPPPPPPPFNDNITQGDSSQQTPQQNPHVTPQLLNQPPIANIGILSSKGTTFTFDASESYDPDGTIVSYYWDFGDGNDSMEINPIHTYASYGEYTVTLTVTDDDGSTDRDMEMIYCE